MHALCDGGELLADGHAVRTHLVDFARELLLEASDSDHEELVEVAPDNRVKLQPLQERDTLALGLGEHSGVELEPG